MKNTATQFRGKTQVLKAYKANDMPAWSLWWTPRDLMARYDGDSMKEGGEQLECALDLLLEGGSEATYTLKVYDDLPKGAKINSMTPYSGSFNFGLYGNPNDGAVGMAPYEQRQSAVLGKIDKRFQELQDKYLGKIMERMEREDEEARAPAKEGGVMGFINGMLDNPAMQQMIVAKIAGLMGAPLPMIPPAAAQVAGVGDAGPTVSPEQYKKLEQAVCILAECDPLIGDHLLALANIAKNNPGKYKTALSFL